MLVCNGRSTRTTMTMTWWSNYGVYFHHLKTLSSYGVVGLVDPFLPHIFFGAIVEEIVKVILP